MRLKQLYKHLLGRRETGRGPQPQTSRRLRLRLTLERLEDRMLPSNYTAGTVSDLIADINAANAAGGSNTITLVAGTTFTLTAVNNTTDGGNGLPVIATNDNLSIVGNGGVIQRSTSKLESPPWFRLFEVASGGSLALANLTLQGGAGFERGGAILNLGNLSLNAVIVQNNVVLTNNYGATVYGGGIYSSGSLTANASSILNNQAVAENDFTTDLDDGASAEGGGLFVLGTASLTNVTMSGNSAQGAQGTPARKTCFTKHDCFTIPAGNGGNGLGGGLYVGSGATVSLHNCTVTSNSALGGKGGEGGGGANGAGEGGGLYIDPLASVCLDAFTVANIINNKTSTSGNNIYGSYTTCP